MVPVKPNNLQLLLYFGKPGPVQDFSAVPTSKIRFMLTWSHPTVNDDKSCNYAGHGGSPITHYVIEYDKGLECTGEYKLFYEIEFDAVHSSGDVFFDCRDE